MHSVVVQAFFVDSEAFVDIAFVCVHGLGGSIICTVICLLWCCSKIKRQGEGNRLLHGAVALHVLHTFRKNFAAPTSSSKHTMLNVDALLLKQERHGVVCWSR